MCSAGGTPALETTDLKVWPPLIEEDRQGQFGSDSEMVKQQLAAVYPPNR